MKVRLIESCDVISHIVAGKKVCCVNFGEKMNLENCNVFDLGRRTIDAILDATKHPGNLFFEKIEEEK